MGVENRLRFVCRQVFRRFTRFTVLGLDPMHIYKLISNQEVKDGEFAAREP